MTKLIVEMEMPQMCPCELATEIEGSFYTCFAYYGVVERAVEFDKCVRDGKRPSWCPIVGVLPEQHGRLVDADACSSVLRKLENEAKTNTEKLCYGYAARMFEEAFTIVAAERKDDERTDKA